jgi:hypothetical protein
MVEKSAAKFSSTASAIVITRQESYKETTRTCYACGLRHTSLSKSTIYYYFICIQSPKHHKPVNTVDEYDVVDHFTDLHQRKSMCQCRRVHH